MTATTLPGVISLPVLLRKAADALQTKLGVAAKQRIAVLVVLLLVIVAAQLYRVQTLNMDRDEIWSVWQTFGTPLQIIQWTPYDWPPLYYLLVGAWRVVAGSTPFALRMMSLLVFLPGLALVYRATCKIANMYAAAIAVSALTAMGYMVTISLLVRAYCVIFTLTALLWWLAIREMESARPRNRLAMGTCMVALFYLHLTTFIGVGLIILYTLLIHPRRFTRWLIPLAISTVCAIPEVLLKLGLATGRASTGLPILQAWLASGALVYRQNLDILLTTFAGGNLTLWAAFVFIAGALLVSRYWIQAKTWALLVWIAAPLFLFFTVLFDAFTSRHLLWVMVGYAVWIGWGMSRLPRSAIVAVVIVFIALLVAVNPIKGVDAPFVGAFAFLSNNLMAGDVVLLDPAVISSTGPEEWDYFTRTYFHNGLAFVQSPGDYRSVWYVSIVGKEDPTLNAEVQTSREAGPEFESDQFRIQRYQRPPMGDQAPFENGMHFLGAEFLDQPGPTPVFRAGEMLKLRLWWSADRQITRDYSVGTYVFAEDKVVAQFDGPPQSNPRETSRWLLNRYYVEDREIKLPDSLGRGAYTVRMGVYQSWDGQRVAAPQTNGDTLLPLLSFQVIAW